MAKITLKPLALGLTIGLLIGLPLGIYLSNPSLPKEHYPPYKEITPHKTNKNNRIRSKKE